MLRVPGKPEGDLSHMKIQKPAGFVLCLLCFTSNCLQ
jgi:hypothetical protein